MKKKRVGASKVNIEKAHGIKVKIGLKEGTYLQIILNLGRPSTELEVSRVGKICLLRKKRFQILLSAGT